MKKREITGIDGTVRKAYYGKGKQPWDEMVELGWAEHFAAGSVLNYLKRDKGDDKHDLESARWYWARLANTKLGLILRGTLRRIISDDIKQLDD